jgi:hypothetical protein
VAAYQRHLLASGVGRRDRRGLVADRYGYAGSDPIDEPVHRRGCEAEAAVRGGCAGDATDVRESVQGDLAGAASNSCKTSERALRASANGAPTAPDGKATASSTKNWPTGVGVEGLPTTAPNVRTSRRWL